MFFLHSVVYNSLLTMLLLNIIISISYRLVVVNLLRATTTLNFYGLVTILLLVTRMNTMSRWDERVRVSPFLWQKYYFRQKANALQI